MAAAAKQHLPPEFIYDFPVMWVAIAWIEQHCVIPDGFNKGDPFELGDWQRWYFGNFYRVKPNARLILNRKPVPAVGASAFHYRRSQCVMPQKAGKGPMTAAHVCLEGVGPALFCGWAQGGEVYRCRDHNCPCGWEYEYEPGEPMGTHWPTPLIQITAFSNEQTFNIYKALRPMITEGPLTEVIPKVFEEFIRLPGGGEIATVTSSQQSRLGQRVTFVPQDETGIWLKQNKMDEVAKTQRRGAAGMGGRTAETTNGWDPSENSVAQATAAAALKVNDIFRLHRTPPAHLKYTVKEDRRRIHRFNYRGCPWVNLDDINAEAEEILLEDPANAERFFGNRIVAGLGAWMPDGLWEETESDLLVPVGTEVAGGFDGSESSDWTAIRLETWDGFRFTPLWGPDRRPTYWDPADHGGSIPRNEVNAAMDWIRRTYKLRRFYADPRDWHSEIGDWALINGDDVVYEWATYRVIQMHAALQRSINDLRSGRSKHDLCAVTADHIANARKIAQTQGDRYILGKPHRDRKIDMAMADTLAHEAASDWRALPPPPVKGKIISHAAYGFN